MDMGNRYIRCAVGRLKDDALKVDITFTITLEDGVYENGVILDSGRLCSAIIANLRLYRVKAKYCVVVTESSEVLKRIISVPQVGEGDIENMLKYEVAQYLPINLDDYIMQHHILGASAEDIEKIDVEIVVMPKELAKSHFDLLLRVNLKPLALDLKSACLLRLIEACNEMDYDKVYAMLDIDYEKTEINIIENKQIRLNRIIGSGLRDLNAVLENHQICSHTEIRQIYDIIAQYGLEHFEVGMKENGMVVSDLLYNDIVAYFADFMSQIERVFKYFTTRRLFNTIDQTLIYGNLSLISEIDKFFESRTNAPTTILQLSNGGVLNAELNSTEYPLYVVALGGLLKK